MKTLEQENSDSFKDVDSLLSHSHTREATFSSVLEKLNRLLMENKITKVFD